MAQGARQFALPVRGRAITFCRRPSTHRAKLARSRASRRVRRPAHHLGLSFTPRRLSVAQDTVRPRTISNPCRTPFICRARSRACATATCARPRFLPQARRRIAPTRSGHSARTDRSPHEACLPAPWGLSADPERSALWPTPFVAGVALKPNESGVERLAAGANGGNCVIAHCGTSMRTAGGPLSWILLWLEPYT